MGKEIHLETLAQGGFIDLGDRSGKGHAGVGNQDVETAESPDGLIESVRHAVFAGEIRFDRQSLNVIRRLVERASVPVEQHDLGALGLECPRRGPPDGAGPAGDDDDVALERERAAAAEFRLLERPVFDVKQVFVWQLLKGPQGVGVTDHFRRGLGQIRRDGRGVTAGAGSEDAQPRHQQHPRRRVQRRDRPARSS